MIAFLQGTLKPLSDEKVLLLTQMGVGYEVHYRPPQMGEENLWITQIIRETSSDLFGFKTLEDKNFFEELLKVKGIGPKSAYALVCNLGTQGIIEAILFENKKALKSVPGVGPKAAAQIILDLQDKVKKFNLTESRSQDSFLPQDNKRAAQEALMELGFDDRSILQVLKNADSELATEEMIKFALKEISHGRQ